MKLTLTAPVSHHHPCSRTRSLIVFGGNFGTGLSRTCGDVRVASSVSVLASCVELMFVIFQIVAFTETIRQRGGTCNGFWTESPKGFGDILVS
jgi:hypothetical protein